MLMVLKVLGITVGIKFAFDILRFAIIEIYYARRGWKSGICTYGIDDNGHILSNVPNKLVRLLMDSRGLEYVASYKVKKWCLQKVKGES